MRVYDSGGDGGMYEGPLGVSCDRGALSLEGDRQFRRRDGRAWARWPVDPQSPERVRMAEEYRESTDSGAGREPVRK